MIVDMDDTENKQRLAALLRHHKHMRQLLERVLPLLPICTGDPNPGCCLYHDAALVLDGTDDGIDPKSGVIYMTSTEDGFEFKDGTLTEIKNDD